MFEQCMYFNTTALARRLEREWTVAFEPFGLTPPQAFLLRVVLKNPGLLQREIARLMSISRPTATRALDALESKAMIVRKGSEKDGRESTVFPTAEAISIQVALDEASAKVSARLKSVLGKESFSDTVARLKEVRAALE